MDSELGFVRVREESTVNSEQIGEVVPGEIYAYDDVQYGWYHVEYAVDEESEFGWVSGSYIEVIE